MKISLVTDSTCDLPVDLVERYQIQVVPNVIIIQGKEYLDGIDFSRQEFYQRLPGLNPPPTTATASSGTYQGMYENLLSTGADYVLSIHTSSKFSGIFNAAHTAAQTFENRVLVVDSGQISLGMGFQVLESALAILHGIEFGKLSEFLLRVQERIRLFAMLDTMEYIRRSGRVSWISAQLGSLFQVKLFLEVKSGQVLRSGESRSRRKGIDRLKGFLLQQGPLHRLAILHSNASDDASQILNDLQPELPTPPLIVNVTTVIGVHVGPNGLGFAAMLA